MHTPSRRSLLKWTAGLLAAGMVPARAMEYWGRQLEDAPTRFIFGYGSLINTASREATAGGKAPAVPARLSGDFGYMRTWNARSPSGFTALGLRPRRPSEPPMTINGVVFPVSEANLPAFDRREGGYRRVEVPHTQIEALSWQGLPEAGVIWAYVPKLAILPDQAADPVSAGPDADHPIVQSYLDLVLEGALDQGSDFARELIATIVDWSPYWLNDRITARRPWVATPLAGRIDALLAATPPASQFLAERLLSEPYAARRLMAR